MSRHGFVLASLAGALLVVVACAPDPAKKPTSTMNIETAGRVGGAAGAAGAPGAAGTSAGEAGNNAAAGSTGMAGDGGGAAGTGAAGDPGAAGSPGAAGVAGGAGSSGAAGSAGSSGGAGAGAAGTTGAAGARPDASVDAGASDARAAEVAMPPPLNPCARTTWKFTPSIVCTTVCAGMAISQKDPANAIDGNADTRYTTGTFQGSQGTETGTLMFPAPVTISGITLVSRGGDGPQLYRVDWSTDGTTFWTFEPAVTGLGSDNMTVSFPAPKKVLGVRVTQLGIKPTNWWSIHEIGVTGCTP